MDNHGYIQWIEWLFRKKIGCPSKWMVYIAQRKFSLWKFWQRILFEQYKSHVQERFCLVRRHVTQGTSNNKDITYLLPYSCIPLLMEFGHCYPTWNLNCSNAWDNVVIFLSRYMVHSQNCGNKFHYPLR